ncbi:uncharacterized protein L969DRAFT_51299 [Mixia osmundae IAM 14324]|uniref:Peptidase S26 domain-containing protein n=1 Tax=Mixia osmundae (strain CBS 9802 / IAM 14324 / JCM 22182 / KY 12970) TaxID=764103 RepID=G7E7I0_MIXOS|nr:uncharacterized protein L969DRAFT_51299 [Mixia osmundae IAM 14324]KEI38393.1 hypothetical protein L969DRAFT_51299 [Mixia osmundae IAM 14324]GAA98790.1 hypothetical protein E5Q_05478 [Mixia osmundae IAM 14324]
MNRLRDRLWVGFQQLRRSPPGQLSAFLTSLTVQVIQVGCLVHLVMNRVVSVGQCSGPSMYPTLSHKHTLVLLDHWSILGLRLRKKAPSIARGDIVVLNSPVDVDGVVCKRVIGLEGDKICFDPSGEWGETAKDDYVIVPSGHKLWTCVQRYAEGQSHRNAVPTPEMAAQSTRRAKYIDRYAGHRNNDSREPPNAIAQLARPTDPASCYLSPPDQQTRLLAPRPVESDDRQGGAHQASDAVTGCTVEQTWLEEQSDGENQRESRK